MALTYGFYNSINHDRTYNAEQISAIFDGLIHDGVFDSIGDILATVPGSGLQVLVKSGKAWFNHTWTLNDATIPLTIQPADVTLARIDAVILEVDATESVRANSIKIKPGIAATVPQKPSMTQTDTIHQYALAYVTVPAKATEIKKENIENNVGKSTCPFVTGIIQSVDIDDLFNKWEGEFDTWFANLKAQLSDNVVANLQAQIDQKLDIASKATLAQIHTSTNNTNYMTPALTKKSVIVNRTWNKLTEYTTAGTFTYIVPNINDNKPYLMGFLMIGGGCSGGVYICMPSTAGGGSGLSRNFDGYCGYFYEVIVEVTPNTKVTVVVGRGGAATQLTISQWVSANGGAWSGTYNAGGDTSITIGGKTITVPGGSETAGGCADLYPGEQENARTEARFGGLRPIPSSYSELAALGKSNLDLLTFHQPAKSMFDGRYYLFPAEHVGLSVLSNPAVFINPLPESPIAPPYIVREPAQISVTSSTTATLTATARINSSPGNNGGPTALGGTWGNNTVKYTVTGKAGCDGCVKIFSAMP